MQNSVKQVIYAFFTNLNEGKTEAAFQLVSDDVQWWVPGNLPFSGTKNKQEYMVIVGCIASSFPKGLHFTVMHMLAEGNQVAAEVESYGEHQNGKLYQNKYHFLFTMRDGIIVAVKEYMDTLHLKELIS